MYCQRRGFEAQNEVKDLSALLLKSLKFWPYHQGHHRTQSNPISWMLLLLQLEGSRMSGLECQLLALFCVSILQGCLVTMPRPNPSDRTNGQSLLG